MKKFVVKSSLTLVGTLIVVVISFAMFPASCFAQEITVAADKDIYYPGDEIVVINKIKNTTDVDKVLNIETRISGVGFRYYPTVVGSGAHFEAGEEKEINFTFYVIETMPAGKYKVISTLLEEEKLLDEATNFLEVTGTLKIIDIELVTCKSKSCDEEATIFYKGETIYLDYKSSIEGLSTKATLILPDKTQKGISIPSSYLLETPGSYILKVIASKEGYKTVDKEIEFGALEEEIKVVEQRPTIEKEIPKLYLIIGAAVVAAIIGSVLVIRLRKKKA
jgi:hypothetical protein